MAPMTYRNDQTVAKATPAWDPYQLFGIYDHKNRGFSCVGTAETQWNSRCRWQFFGYAAPPIAAFLDSMAACDPSEISQKSLECLARMCLCPENHQKEAPEKAREWYDKISVFLDDKARTAALTADVQRLNMLVKSSESENARLEKRADAVKAEMVARLNEIESLSRQMNGFQATFENHNAAKKTEVEGLMKRLENSSAKLEEALVTNMNVSRELEAIKGRLQQSHANLATVKESAQKEIDGLKTERETNAKLLNDAKSQALNEINDLKMQLEESENDLEASEKDLAKKEKDLEEKERTSSQEIDKLNAQLKDSNARLETLQTSATQDSEDIAHLRQEIQHYRKQNDDSKIKNNARVSDLLQQTDTLNAQRHFRAFRTQVHLAIKQKRLEQAEGANAKLREQREQLMEQISDMDQQLTAQNVSIIRIEV